MILAGDIGGTKAHLALYGISRGRPEIVHQQFLPCRGFGGLLPLLGEFMEQHSVRPTAACFGLAGRIEDGRCEMTNLPWVIDVTEVRDFLGTDDVWLLNDLEALGFGIPLLPEEEFCVLQRGRAREGNAALVAAGTGLGESILFWNGESHIPSASEGGHADFAPRNEWEMDLLKFLSARYGHVSYERILSGAGFVDLFDFAVSIGIEASKEVLRARANESDPAPIISRAGLEGSCPASAEILNHFVEIYGAEAANLALKSMAVAGVYVGGGVVGKILPKLKEDGFMNAFLDKGRFNRILEQIPVRIVLQPLTVTLGAAQYVCWTTQRR